MEWPLRVLKWLPVAVVMAIAARAGFALLTGPASPFAGAGQASGDSATAARRNAGLDDVAGVARSNRAYKIEEANPGPYRHAAARVADVRDDGTVVVERIDPEEAHKRFDDTLCGIVLRSHGKAPLNERFARKTTDPSSSDEAKTSRTGVHVGDIFVSGLPMIDQGENAYCAVASAARVLQGYGIEVTMEDMAKLANSSPTGGTSIPSWQDAIREVVRDHGLELKVIPELTESMQPLGTLIQNYNYTARKMGCEELDWQDYIGRSKCGCFFQDYASYGQDRDYAVQREVMLSNDRACDAFEENIVDRVDASDPLFWSVKLGDVAEDSSYFDAEQSKGVDSAHMRLIIGYNENDGEILYTDSWGPGHELKRMDANDALSITRGMFYLKDNPGSGSAAKVQVSEQ